MVDMESHRRRRHMKEAGYVRQAVINQDKGNYKLPQVYNDVILRRRH